MRKTDVSNANNKDILHDTALTSYVMNVINTVILSWVALTGYPLLEHQDHTTRHAETATPDQALDTTRKTKKGAIGPDHSLDIVDTAAPTVVICTEAALDHNNGTGSAAIETAQDDPVKHIEDTITGPIVTHHTGQTANPPYTAVFRLPLSGLQQITFMPTLLIIKVYFTPKRITQFGIMLQSENPKITAKKEHKGPDRRITI